MGLVSIRKTVAPLKGQLEKIQNLPTDISLAKKNEIWSRGGTQKSLPLFPAAVAQEAEYLEDSINSRSLIREESFWDP
jgi:hypothetical protein